MKKVTKKIVNVVLFVAFFTLIICIIISNKREKQIPSELSVQQNENIVEESLIIKIEENEQQNEVKNVKEYSKVEIADTYRGYDVCAELEIPAISLVTNVLKNYSTAALNISVTKFWGVEPNQIGNFCVAGHNFKNKNMFRNLKKLDIGDKLYITDREVGKVAYEIFDIYKVFPETTSCLTPATINEREGTLITCTTDSKQRIIVKAKEI